MAITSILAPYASKAIGTARGDILGPGAASAADKASAAAPQQLRPTGRVRRPRQPWLVCSGPSLAWTGGPILYALRSPTVCGRQPSIFTVAMNGAHYASGSLRSPSGCPGRGIIKSLRGRTMWRSRQCVTGAMRRPGFSPQQALLIRLLPHGMRAPSHSGQTRLRASGSDFFLIDAGLFEPCRTRSVGFKRL